MQWTKIKAGHYLSVSPKTYTASRDGVGLFREGWRPSWKLRWKDGDLLGEHSSFRSAKAHANRHRKWIRMGIKRIRVRFRSRLNDAYPTCRTAYHEAGHILVDRLTTNRRIISATCVPGDGYAGQVVFESPTQGSVDQRTARGIIKASLAGIVAETFLTQKPVDLQALNQIDRAPLSWFGPSLCEGGDLDGFAQELAEETLVLLRNNKESLRLLAITLRRMGDLNSRQIKALLRRMELVFPETTAA